MPDVAEIKKYIDTINLSDYDLDNVELVDEDYDEIIRKINAGLSLPTAIGTHLCEIRQVLDEGLD